MVRRHRVGARRRRPVRMRAHAARGRERYFCEWPARRDLRSGRYHASGSANANGDDYDLSGHVTLERSSTTTRASRSASAVATSTPGASRKLGQDDGYVYCGETHLEPVGREAVQRARRRRRRLLCLVARGARGRADARAVGEPRADAVLYNDAARAAAHVPRVPAARPPPQRHVPALRRPVARRAPAARVLRHGDRGRRLDARRRVEGRPARPDHGAGYYDALASLSPTRATRSSGRGSPTSPRGARATTRSASRAARGSAPAAAPTRSTSTTSSTARSARRARAGTTRSCARRSGRGRS